MSTIGTIKTALSSIISKANAKTGASDTTVNAAVDRLISGYGTGSGVTPSGSVSITTNGSHDVTNYTTANVNVPVGITPSGTLEITQNGTYDVTNKASAVVNVPTGGGSDNFHVLPFTITSNQGAGTNVTDYRLVTGDAWVKANYAKAGFFAMMIPLTATSSVLASNFVPFIYAGNRAIANSKAVGYGIMVKCAGSSGYAAGQILTTKVSANGYNATIRVNSSGNISLYIASTYTVPAGDYLLVYGLAE